MARTKTKPNSSSESKKPLSQVVALVDVYSDGEFAHGIVKLAEELGAAIRKTLSSDVTHVIFKSGKKALLQKALGKENVKVVRAHWLDKCREQQKQVDETTYEFTLDMFLEEEREKKRNSIEGKQGGEEVFDFLETSQSGGSASTVVSTTPSVSAAPNRSKGATPKKTPKESPAEEKGRTEDKRVNKSSSNNSNKGDDHDGGDDDDNGFKLTSPTKTSPRAVRTYGKKKARDVAREAQPAAQPQKQPDPPSKGDVEEEQPQTPQQTETPMVAKEAGDLSTENGNSKAEEQPKTTGETKKRKGKAAAKAEPEHPREEPEEEEEVSEAESAPRKRGTKRKAVTTEAGEEKGGGAFAAIPAPAEKKLRSSAAEKKDKDKVTEKADEKENRSENRKQRETKQKGVPGKRKQARQKEDEDDEMADAKDEETESEGPRGVLLVTGFFPQDGVRDIVISTAQHLGGFKIIGKHEKKLRPTHVVCGEQRTLSVLLGILHGCWLLTPEWAMASLEKGKWQNEEGYQARALYPRAVATREERLTSKHGLLLLAHQVFIGSLLRGERGDLAELLKLVGGKVTDSVYSAAFILGSYDEKEGRREKPSEKKTLPVMVREKWLFDSITECKKLPFDEYLLNEAPKKGVDDSPEY